MPKHSGLNGQDTTTNGSSSSHRDGQHASRNSKSSPFNNGSLDDDVTDPSIDFIPLWPNSSLDKRELIKLTLQSLKEMGYDTSAKTLEAESGVSLEHPSITAFRSAALSGDWKNAERLLVVGLTFAARKLQNMSNSSSDTNSLDSVLRKPAVTSLKTIKFMLQRQRYLELLEMGQTKKALSVLRDRLTPLNQSTEQLHLLSSLVMCASPEELRSRANWDGANGESRRLLLMEIEASVSPSAILPSRRLPKLLEQAQSYQKQQDPFYNQPHHVYMSLFLDHQTDRSVFPSEVSQVLRGHENEVWCLEYSHDGTKLATAGKDKMVLIWSVGNEYTLLERIGPFSDSVSSVSWSPDDQTLLVTSELDVTLCDAENTYMHTFCEHEYTVGTACWLPDGSGFVTGGMDGKIIFWHDDGRVSLKHSASPFRVLAIAVSPDGRHLVALSYRPLSNVPANAGRVSSSTAPPSSGASSSQYSDSPSPASTSTGLGLERGFRSSPADIGGGSRVMTDEKYRIHFWDLKEREEVGSIYLKEELISVTISGNSRYALINQRPNEMQLWDIEQQTLVRKFNGHTLKEHVIRCGFGGIDENFVVSGSEDSCIYVWHRPTGRLIETLVGHEKGTENSGSVSAVAWHPTDPTTVASCGDDATVRIWRPGHKLSAAPTLSANKEVHLALGDTDMNGANPFPWSGANGNEDEMMGSMHEAMD